VLDETLFEMPEPTEPPRNKDGSWTRNRMLDLYGPGPDDRKCKDCEHFEVHQQGKRWFKCALRPPGYTRTDHRANWPTCGRFIGADA
jgi:hypothetical protein